MDQKADRVLKNAKIITVDESFSFAEALAVKDGRIVYVGDNAGAEAFIGPETVVSDLTGLTVTPGFIENHMHMNEYGHLLGRLDNREKSKEEILAIIKERVAKARPGEWIVGSPKLFGFDYTKWADPRRPFPGELEAIAPDNPVVMFPNMAGVGNWANRKALEMMGIDPDDPAVLASRFVNDDGTVSACYGGKISPLIWYYTSKPHTWEEKKRAYLEAEKALYSFGVTALNDAANAGAIQNDVEKLYRDGELSIRYYGCLSALSDDPETDAYLERCPITEAYGGRYHVITSKLGATTKDYDWLLQKAVQCYKKGMQLMTHAIEEEEIDRIVRVYEEIEKEYGPIRDRRCRIEHFAYVARDLPERVKAMGVIPSMQAGVAPGDSDALIRQYGPEKARFAWSTRKVLDRVGIVLGGSDAPCTPPRPMSNIHSAVTCKTDHLEPEGGFYPENRITMEEAIRSHTIWGAYAQFSEHERGSLEVGKLADYVILDGDPMTVEPDDLLNIHAVETVLEGETKFKA